MMHSKSIPHIRFLPFLLVFISVLMLLKFTNVYIGVSSLAAQNTPGSFFSRDKEPETENTEIGFAREGDNAIANPAQNEVVFVNDDNAQNLVEDRLLKRLSERRAFLEEREAVLETRENLIKAAEFQLDEKIQTLKIREDALLVLEKKRDEAQSEELKALISAYERMKPRDAARIFEILDDELLISVSSQMRTQALSGVLSQMSPERARQLTRLLAKSNDAPIEPPIARSTTKVLAPINASNNNPTNELVIDEQASQQKGL